MSLLRTPKKLSHWLTNRATQIGYYQKKAQQLLAFNQRWAQQTHIPLAQHSTIANWDGTALVLAVEHSGWASELHYEKPVLCSLFTTWPGLSKLVDITWYVEVCQKPSLRSVTPKKALMLSASNKHLLQSVAGTLAYPELSAALLKLANYSAFK